MTMVTALGYRSVRLLSMALLLFFASTALASAKAPHPPQRRGGPNPARISDRTTEPEYVEGEIIVKFKKGASDQKKAQLHRAQGAAQVRDLMPLRLQRVKLKKGDGVPEAVASYKKDPIVEYAEPNYIVTANAIPNDPMFPNLWALSTIHAPAAWEMTTGNAGVVVAVIDTGLDASHPDLQGNIWVNSAEIPGNGIDDDGNGYVDDIHGINAITGSGNPLDDNGHGTHVAGTIGAAGNNGLGVVGVNWSVKLIGAKFLDASGRGSIGDAIECLLYLKGLKERASNPVNIIASNNSWGGGAQSQALSDAIASLQEVLFIAAAGNNGSDGDTSPHYPSAYSLPHVISVAATDSLDELAPFSNYGRRSVDIGAPGVEILSTVPAVNKWGVTGGYTSLSGTSMATPHVTGLAALLKAQAPSRDWRAVRNLILAGGDPVSAMAGVSVTGKRINAHGSLSCVDNQLFSVLDIPADVQPGEPVTISALSIKCGAPLGGVEATTSAGETIVLRDDGISPDLASGDGIFTATWTPLRRPERLVFIAPAGSETIPLPAIHIDNFVPSANVGLPHRQPLMASGGKSPLSWSVVSGTLPPGLSLDAAGAIAGTATESGTWPITVMVTDAWGTTATRELALHAVESPIVETWGRMIHTSRDDSGKGVAADADGNSYVVAALGNAADLDILLTKYDPAGNQLWAYRYDRGDIEMGYDVAIDPSGDVIIGGSSSHYNYLVLKFSPTGELLWEKTASAGVSTYAHGITADAEGSIIIAGYTWIDDGAKIFTAKLSPEGEEIWRRIYNGTFYTYGTAVGVDASGNAYVAGYEGGPPDYQYDFLLLKYDPEGNLLWTRKEDDGTEQDEWEDVAVDAGGNVYLSGHKFPFIAARKYDASGNTLWTSYYDAWGVPNGYSIAVDAAGRSYVAGFQGNGYSDDFLILCYSPGGELLWSRTSDSGVQSPDGGKLIFQHEAVNAVAIDPAGSIIATGTFFNGLNGEMDVLTIRYDLAPLALADTELPTAFAHASYMHSFSAPGGAAPLSWSVVSGGLPTGLALDAATGLLSGTPTAPGTFPFTLRVADVMGRVLEKPLSLPVVAVVPDFLATPLTGFAPLPVSFTDTSGGSLLAWSWSFGDGGASTNRNPSHTYTTAGTYTVALTATTAAGSGTKAREGYITVLACPNQPVRLPRPAPLSFSELQNAYGQAEDDDIIQLQALDFAGNFLFDRPVRIAVKGGYDCGFSGTGRRTGVLGTLRVTAGTARIDSLAFR